MKDALKDALPYIQLIAMALTTLVTWGFATGRWVGKQETEGGVVKGQAKADDVAALRQYVNELAGKCDKRHGDTNEYRNSIHRRFDDLNVRLGREFKDCISKDDLRDALARIDAEVAQLRTEMLRGYGRKG